MDNGPRAVDDILDKLINNSQNRARSVVHNFVEHVMLDRLRRDVIGEIFYAYITNYFDTEIATEGFTKRLLTSSLFIAWITTDVRQ